MAGSLVHGRSFRKAEYHGRDGLVHHELEGVGVDDDLDVMSHSSWSEVLRICEAHGIARERMPDFAQYSCGIDVPLEEVLAKNVGLLERLRTLPAEVVGGHAWLAQIVGYVEAGYLVYFSD